MTDEPFGRQPQPVKLAFTGDQRDVEYYLGKLKGYIERQSYDVCTRVDNTLTIHPSAVND